MDASAVRLFGVAYTLGALIALGGIGKRKEKITLQAILGALFYDAMLGLGLGMYGYEYLNWKNGHEWCVVASSMLGGARAFRLSDVTTLLRRFLAITNGGDGKRD